MPLAALLLLLAAGMFTLAEDLYNTSQLGQITRKQEVYGLQVNDSFLIKGPFWYPSSASRNYLLLSDSRGFATWGQLPDTLPTQHHFTNRVTAQYFAIDTMLFTKHLTSGVVKTNTGGGVYVDTVPANWCDSIANCINEQAWGLTGNSGTTAGTNFIGTTDSKSLYFKTKNTTAIVVDTNQNVGIGTAMPYSGFAVVKPEFNFDFGIGDGSKVMYGNGENFVVSLQAAYGAASTLQMDTLGKIAQSGNYLNIVFGDSISINSPLLKFPSGLYCYNQATFDGGVFVGESTTYPNGLFQIGVGEPGNIFMGDYYGAGNNTWLTVFDDVNTIRMSADSISFGGDIIPGFADTTYNLGSESNRFNKLFTKGVMLTGVDSATIYALTPQEGAVYHCTDCTGDGITGRIVTYIGAMWRRLKFE